MITDILKKKNMTTQSHFLKLQTFFRLTNVTNLKLLFLLDAIWLHIRVCGEWTSRLYEYFEREQEKLQSFTDHVSRTRRTASIGKRPAKSKAADEYKM